MAKVLIASVFDDPEGDRYLQALEDGLSKSSHEMVIESFQDRPPGTPLADQVVERLPIVDVIIFLVSPKSVENPFLLREAEVATAYRTEQGHPQILTLAVAGVHFNEVPPPLNHHTIIRAQRLEDVGHQILAAVDRIEGARLAREEKKREIGRRIEKTAAAYIAPTLEALQQREKHYRRWAVFWYGTAYASLIAGGVVAFKRAYQPVPPDVSWPAVIQVGVLMAIALGLLAAMARLSFVLGKSYVVEALRNSDRIHAIRFGEFYLQAFPDEMQWAQVKDAFQHWNIDAGSAFRHQDAADVDPEILKKLVELAKTIKG